MKQQLKKNMFAIFMNSKGGVGKTTTVKITCEYLKANNVRHMVIDTDCTNKLLSSSKAYKAIPWKLTDADNLVSSEKIPELITSYADAENLVIDTGANTYQPWILFFKDNAGREICEAYGFQVVINIPVVPGQMFEECISCVEEICEADPKITIAVWLNNGYNSKNPRITISDFHSTPIYKKYSQNIIHVIELPPCDPIRKKLVDKLDDSYLSMSEIADVSPDKLIKIKLGDRCASMADKLIITKYRSLLFDSIKNSCFPLFCFKDEEDIRKELKLIHKDFVEGFDK